MVGLSNPSDGDGELSEAWKQPHETTKPKHRWERIEGELEMDPPAWSNTHTFLTDAHVYISAGR